MTQDNQMRPAGKLSNGTTIMTNIDGFELLNGEGLARAMVGAGLMTQAECDAALERRAARCAARQSNDMEGEGRDNGIR